MDQKTSPDLTTPATTTVSEARLRSVLDTAVFGIIVADQLGHILLFNKACEALFGFSAEEAVGQNLSILMSGFDAGRHDAYMAFHAWLGLAAAGIGAFAVFNGYFKRTHNVPEEIDGKPNYQMGPVKLATVASVFWGVAGFLVGLIIALQLAWPSLNLDLPCPMDRRALFPFPPSIRATAS